MSGKREQRESSRLGFTLALKLIKVLGNVLLKRSNKTNFSRMGLEKYSVKRRMTWKPVWGSREHKRGLLYLCLNY